MNAPRLIQKPTGPESRLVPACDMPRKRSTRRGGKWSDLLADSIEMIRASNEDVCRVIDFGTDKAAIYALDRFDGLRRSNDQRYPVMLRRDGCEVYIGLRKGASV